MKKLLPFLFVLLISIVRGQDSASVKKDSTPWALYHAIEARLDTVFDDDQSSRKHIDDIAKKYGFHSRQMDSLTKVMGNKDSINLLKVTEVLDKYGWLGIDDIGEKANAALFVVLQHADRDSGIQVKYLPMMREAVKNKKAQSDQLALLEDRVLTNHGKPQIYGTQVHTAKNGKYVLYPIADERNVNQRRSAIGLDPLEVYARYFGIDYHLPK